jgi:hypothetical protein
MNRKNIAIAFIFFLWASSSVLLGQTKDCGTYIDSAAQVALENTFTITAGQPNQSIPQVKRTLSITVHIVKDAQGLIGFTIGQLESVVIFKLNEAFAPIDLKFRICSTNYINNYQYDNLVVNSNEKELLSISAEPNTINLYIVSNIYDKTGVKVCGYTYMPGTAGKNCIFISKSCLLGSSVAHQVGHFFNLYHTHEKNTFGAELVSRTNCATAGDRCCDTEADPNLDGKVTNCIYTGNDKDASSKFYGPSPKNFMSLSPEECRCNFTRTQFLRMIYALNTTNFRKYLR